MKKMLRSISLLLVLVMLVSVFACDFGSSGDDKKPDDNNGEGTGEGSGEGGSGDSGNGEGGSGGSNGTLSAEGLFADLSAKVEAAKTLSFSVEITLTERWYDWDSESYQLEEGTAVIDAFITEDADGGVAVYLKATSPHGVDEMKIVGGKVYSRDYNFDDDGNAPETLPQYALEASFGEYMDEDMSAAIEELVAYLEELSKDEDISSCMQQISDELDAILGKWMTSGKIESGSWSWKNDYASKIAIILDYVDGIDPETKTLGEFINELLTYVLPGVTVEDTLDAIVDYSDYTLSDLIEVIDGYLEKESTSVKEIWEELRASEELDTYLEELELPEAVLAYVATVRAMSYDDIVKEYGVMSVDDIACYVYMILSSGGEAVPDEGYDNIDTFSEDDGYADSGEFEEIPSYTQLLVDIAKGVLDTTLEELEIDAKYMVYHIVGAPFSYSFEYGDRYDKLELGAKLCYDVTTFDVSSLIFSGELAFDGESVKVKLTITPSATATEVSAPTGDELYSGIYGSKKAENDGCKVSVYASRNYLSFGATWYDAEGEELYYISVYYSGSVYYGQQFEADYINAYAYDVRYNKPVEEYKNTLGKSVKVTINEDLSFEIEGFSPLTPSNDIYGSGGQSFDSWYLYYYVFKDGGGYININRRGLIDDGYGGYDTVEYYTFRVSFDGEQQFGVPFKASVSASAYDMRYSKAAEEFNKKYADKEITFTLNSDLTYMFGDGFDGDDLSFAESDGIYGEHWETFYDKESDWGHSVRYTYTDECKYIVIYKYYEWSTVYMITIDLSGLEAAPKVGESFTATLVADTYGDNADEINAFNEANGAVEFTVTVYEDLSVEIDDFYGIPGIDIEAE